MRPQLLRSQSLLSHTLSLYWGRASFRGAMPEALASSITAISIASYLAFRAQLCPYWGQPHVIAALFVFNMLGKSELTAF